MSGISFSKLILLFFFTAVFAVPFTNAQYKTKFEVDSLILEQEQTALKYVFEGNIAEALILFDSIFRFTEDELVHFPNNTVLQAFQTQIMISLGAVYEELGDRDKAAGLYMQALERCENLDYDEGKARIYNNLGKISYLGGKLEQAEDYFEKSLEINLKMGKKPAISDNYSNLAAIPVADGNFEKALEYCFRSLEISKELKMDYDVALIYSNIAIIYKEYDSLDRALSYLDMALEIEKENGFIDAMAESYLKYATIFLDQKDFHRSLEYALLAWETCRDLSQLPVKTKAVQHISNCYDSLAVADSALHYLKIYHAFNDSMYNILSENKIQELETIYRVKERDQHIAFLEKKSVFEKRRQRLWIGISIALLGLAILLFYFIRLKNEVLSQNKQMYEKDKHIKEIQLQQKEKENKLLHAEKRQQDLESKLIKEKLKKEEEEGLRKSRELSTAVLHITNKNAILNDIKNRLENANIRDKQLVRSISSEIDQSRQLDKDWEQFKLHFEAVHPGFFDKLLGDFPNLSQNELKLSAYLRMNLTSKEIAQMLNITLAGVNKSRQRLRKKLELDSEVNLMAFMMKY